MKQTLLLTFIYLLTLTAMNTSAVQRDDYGKNNYPIWSPLSSFENQTLDTRFAAQNGDPDALLALYIMASGSYSQNDFALAQQSIQEFTHALKAQSVKKLKPKQQGKTINNAMHFTFFADPQAQQHENNEEPSDDASQATHQNNVPASHYKAEQSALAGIFINRDFNCISSSLLYAVLIRKFGLQGRGIILPSHAFIELNFGGGESVDVETTSPNGYDQKHDIDFYATENNHWANTRGLTPTTYNDYLNRERLGLWQLGTRNMLHQHTHPDKMSAIDRGRLAELSAFLDPSYEAAQVNRMVYYTQEAEFMLQQKLWFDLTRMINITFDTLEQDVARFSRNESLQNSFFWLHLMAIKAFAEVDEADKTLRFVRRSMSLAYSTEQRSRVKNSSIDALDVLLKYALNKNDFNAGLYLLSAIEPYSSDHPHYPDSVKRLYSKWAEFNWKQKNWADSVSILEDYFLQPYLTDNTEDMQTNLANAYGNWIGSELDLKNIDGAKAIGQQCEMQHFDNNVCNQARDKLRAYLRTNTQKTTGP